MGARGDARASPMGVEASIDRGRGDHGYAGMAKKPTHVIVKSHHPRLRRALSALLGALVLAAIWGSFEYGRARGGFDVMEAERRQDALLARIRSLEEDNRRLSAQNAILRQGGEIDRHAYAEVDRTLAALQDEILNLKQEVAFYRGIVNSGEGARGLHIQGFRLEQNGDGATYRYRLILTQFAMGNRVVQGVAEMTVSGILEGAQIDLTQREIAPEKGQDMRFRFKYFQELEGSFTLPDGFVPLRITLRAVPRGKGEAAVERTYSWSELIS